MNMAFHVTTVHHNSYRCSCCRRESESSRWLDSLDEALAEVPVEPPEESEFGGLYSVNVMDGSTGERVAWAMQSWSVGFGKYSGYTYTRWSGYRPDVGAFETIRNREGQVVEGKTWEALLSELSEAHRQKEIERLERVEAETRAALEKLKGPSPAA